MDEENEAIANDRDKTIARLYYGKDGGSTPCKPYLDANAIDSIITLDWVRSWFKKNIERTKQVGGRRTAMWRHMRF